MRILFFVFMFNTLLVASAEKREHNILVLLSSHSGTPWTKLFLKGLEDIKNTTHPNANYFIESLDSRRVTEDIDAQLWVEYLGKKYADIRFDGAIAESNVASRLLSKYGDKFLEPNVPRAFLTAEEIAAFANVLTLKGDIQKSVKETIKIALNASKGLKKAYIIKGDSLPSKKLYQHILQEIKNYPNIAVETIDAETLDEVSQKLSLLSSESVVFYTLLFRDGKERKLTPREALSIISKKSHAPIYTFYTSLLDAGVVGGHMLDAELIAKEMAQALFDYKNSAMFAKHYSTTQSYIDSKQAKKYAIDTAAFPKDFTFVNREVSLWESHKSEVIITLLFITILVLLLILVISLNSSLAREIDERKKQQALLVQQAKLASMGEMIQNIAHQWRQPLSVIGLLFARLDIAKELGIPNEKVLKEVIIEGEQIVQQMNQTIEDFRDFFKPNKEKSYFVLQDVVKSSLSFIEATIGISGIRLKVRECHKEVVLHGYPSELSQALLNLLLNAKDAVIENKNENPKIELLCYERENKIFIEICDNGGGVPEALLSKIFEPYFSTKKSEQGTGIGLYMSKQIIESSMGGNLSVQNNDSGARFIVVLPKSS